MFWGAKMLNFDTWKKNHNFEIGIISTKFSLSCTLSLVLGMKTKVHENKNLLVRSFIKYSTQLRYTCHTTILLL